MIRIGYETSQTQRLDLKLAPKMIQSMEVLQLPSVALQERIETELKENPVLELRDGSPTDRDADAGDRLAVEDNFNPEAVLKHDAADPGAELEFQRLDALDRDWDGYFNEDEHRPSRAAIDELGDQKLDVMQNIVDRPQSLQDHLAEQLVELEMSADDRALALHIISYIDSTGWVGRRNEKGDFLPVSLFEIAATCDPPANTTDVERVLHMVQELDPPGVGARDYKECLLLQLTDDTPHRDLVRTIILEHMEDVAHQRLVPIHKKTGQSIDTIRDAIEVIRHLNPKPGAQFTAEITRYVLPDVVIEKTDEGLYTIRLTEDWEPRLRIPKRYYTQFKDKTNDPKFREQLRKKLQSAQWLIDAIKQRRDTLERVTRAIIDHQKAFLDIGPEHIVPLKMQQIADQVKVHVTTVSRAVDSKWIQTPRGMFPLKRFFVGAATNKETGEQIPWEKVKSALLEMVNTEDKNSPLSDEELEERLQQAGYPVKRRTVTKYRKLLHIASSRERKAWAG